MEKVFNSDAKVCKKPAITLKEYINNKLQKKGYKIDNIAKIILNTMKRRDERDDYEYYIKYIECEPFLQMADELFLPSSYTYDYIKDGLCLVMDDGSVFDLYRCIYYSPIKSLLTAYDVVNVSNIVSADEKFVDSFDKDLFYRKAYLKRFLITTDIIKHCDTRMRNFAKFQNFRIKCNDDFFYIHNLCDDGFESLVLRQMSNPIAAKYLNKIVDNNYKYNIFYEKDNEFVIIDKFNDKD